MSEKKITPLHYETLIRIFEVYGFAIKRRKGDHIIMTKANVKRVRLFWSMGLSASFQAVTGYHGIMESNGMEDTTMGRRYAVIRRSQPSAKCPEGAT